MMVLSWSFCGTAMAQSGCVNSPENPSVVLGALALAAAGVPWLRAKWQQRRKP
jgi:hypothetical protein